MAGAGVTAKGNAVLVEALGSSLRYGGSALQDVPTLLKRILAEEAWREFATPRGELARHDRFADFVTTQPTKGLGASMELIDRIVGTDDPDLLRMLREAKKVGQGHRSDLSHCADSTRSRSAEDSANTVDRLAREAPEELAAIERGEKTIHAAALAAGIRRRRVPVRLDSAESAAKTLRKHMPPEARQALARLLLDENPGGA